MGFDLEAEESHAERRNAFTLEPGTASHLQRPCFVHHHTSMFGMVFLCFPVETRLKGPPRSPVAAQCINLHEKSASPTSSSLDILVVVQRLLRRRTSQHGAAGKTLDVASTNAFGAPSVFLSSPLGFRCAGYDFRYPGIGCYIVGLTGKTVVVSWPMSRAVAADESLLNELDFLEGMSGGAAKAAEHMSSMAHWCSVSTGETVWVPYGHHVWLLAEPCVDRSSVIWMPIFSLALTRGIDAAVWAAIAKEIMEIHSTNSGFDPVKFYFAGLQKFLKAARAATGA